VPEAALANQIRSAIRNQLAKAGANELRFDDNKEAEEL